MPPQSRKFYLHRQFVDEHVGCEYVDMKSATSSRFVSKPCSVCLDGVCVPTFRHLHVHRDFVDEHIQCPRAISTRSYVADNGAADSPCLLCADDNTNNRQHVKGRSALLCRSCFDDNRRRTTPGKSIAAGYQRGSLRPFNIRELNVLEEQAIAVTRPYMFILKVSGANAGSGAQPVL